VAYASSEDRCSGPRVGVLAWCGNAGWRELRPLGDYYLVFHAVMDHLQLVRGRLRSMACGRL
jgi:hypothetical protein